MNEIKSAKSLVTTASLTLSGEHQILEIPEGFELPGTEITITKDGDRLVLEAKREKRSLKDILDSWEPLTEEEWPDITDDDLGPLRDVDL